MAISGSETPSQASPPTPTPTPPPTTTMTTKAPPSIEVETAKCVSCGFTEECTPAYILRIRDQYQGRWICGLCIQAVKDEVSRADGLISTEEALNRHISFCKKFKSSNPMKETEHPIFAMGKLIRRSLDSPRAVRSNSSGALQGIDAVRGITTPALLRSGSCFSSISS
ncbi:hypothetical protein BT93_L5744 [Corymbia citriodora subsp. variegata]|uniref:Uncharacterized protein n=1 Tax=Corymbia citriodora subsp. variegata TaxID=360336 RepID=A0A8T0CRB8_CORYI|nr:hypothetical protein BT93_L5744 [Corymbia citriodora subsp. variegata]